MLPCADHFTLSMKTKKRRMFHKNEASRGKDRRTGGKVTSLRQAGKESSKDERKEGKNDSSKSRKGGKISASRQWGVEPCLLYRWGLINKKKKREIIK